MLLSCLLASQGHAQRLKDMVSISGVRSNQLIGYGLVVGLNGTGDQTTQTPFTIQTFNNMMKQFGIKPEPGVRPIVATPIKVATTTTSIRFRFFANIPAPR